MERDEYVARQRERFRAARKGKGSGKLKFVGAGILAALVVIVVVAAFALVSAGPTMLVLGALHSSDGLSFVPALGFWQTLGSLFVIGSVGRAFHPTQTGSKS